MTYGLGIIVKEDNDKQGFWLHVGLVAVLSIHFKLKGKTQ